MSGPESVQPALVITSAAEFQLAVNATSEQMADLLTFYELLGEWRVRMNLVGPTAMAEFWHRHVYDSAQLLHVEQSALQWADVGAGAGFPGIILAILLKTRRGAKIHLIESTAKRGRFLQHVVSTLALPAEVHHVRAEELSSPKGLEVVTARACAPFPRLFSYTAHFFQAGARGLFLKGRDVELELTKARRDWTFESELIASCSDVGGRIVRVDTLKSRG